MGLDCSHDAWHGAYSAFKRFRRMIAMACGGSWPPHDPEFRMPDGSKVGDGWWFTDDDVVPADHHEGCDIFMGHSDCEGEISPGDCLKVAGFLRWVAPRLQAAGTGHLSPLSMGPRDRAVRFAEGCEAAAAAGEPLVFS